MIIKRILNFVSIIITFIFASACLDDGGGSGGMFSEVSGWSDSRNVTDIYVFKNTGRLRFIVQGTVAEGNPPLPIGEPPHITCAGDESQLDLHIDPAAAEEDAEIKMFTNILFAAFIRHEKVEVRTDRTECSNGNKFLVKDVRTSEEPGEEWVL